MAVTVSDLELCQGLGVKKEVLTFFEGFESRAAGGGKKPPAAGAAGALEGPSKPSEVLYSVRWVQAPKVKDAGGPKTSSAARAGEVRKLNMTMELPQDGLGATTVPVRISGSLGV
mmetsp:Transcript_130541/g.325682  ORF Transcript_130541/g.325682 Transcript_130541/m.325682 type:complete len:115 (-) Transcript_130541:135-479(-)